MIKKRYYQYWDNTGSSTLFDIASINDTLGREVAVLADGMKEAGYYTATFIAVRLASGVYFARFTATPQDGSKPIAITRKMLLTK